MTRGGEVLDQLRLLTFFQLIRMTLTNGVGAVQLGRSFIAKMGFRKALLPIAMRPLLEISGVSWVEDLEGVPHLVAAAVDAGA